MAGGRVLPARAFREPAGDGRRARLRRASLERRDVPEPERLERRQVEAADGARDVAEGVRAPVAVVARVGQLSRPDGVEDDHACARQAYGSGFVEGLRSRLGLGDSSKHSSLARRREGYPKRVETVLGLIGLVLFIVAVVALAAGITWLVVRFSPNPENKRKKAAAAAAAATGENVES